MKKICLCMLLVMLSACPAMAVVISNESPPTITRHPMHCTALKDTMAEFSVTATGTEPLRYQWQKSPNDDGIWSDIFGTNSSDYSFIATTSSMPFYRVVVFNDYGSATSDRAMLNIYGPAIPIPLITIVTQPIKNIEVTEGSIIGSLSVEAYIEPSGTLTYQWYSNTINSNIDGTLIPGAVSASFTIPKTLEASNIPYYYYCIIEGTAPDFSPLSTHDITEVAAITVLSNSDDSNGGGCNNMMTNGGTFCILAALSTLWFGQKNKKNEKEAK